MKEEDWAKHDRFDADTALVVKHAPTGNGQIDDAADIYDFFINVDNKHLRTEQKESREDAALLEDRFVHALTLIGVALIQDAQIADRVDADRDGDVGMSVDERVRMVTRAVAPFLLPMIYVLGDRMAES